MSGGTIEYYAIEGVPGRYFKCPNGVGKLSDKACAGLYTEAMSPKGLREGLRFKCRACPLGAEHAGVKPLEAGASGFLSKLACARCQRPATRLIRKVICVSCYNREREVLIGKNAKGNRPSQSRHIGPTPVAYCEEGSWRVRQIDLASGPVEAVLTVMREDGRSANFSWVSHPIIKGGGDAAESVRAA